jgi:hypothetical protein
MKNANTKYTVELTYEELRLIRQACFSHERDLGDDILKNKRYSKTSEDGYWADRVQIDQNEYFDTQALRGKVMDTIRDEMRAREEAEQKVA